MTVIAHPASKPHFDVLLYQEINITHHLLISLIPILQNLALFSQDLRFVRETKSAPLLESVRMLNASFETLSQTLTERSERIAYYKRMGCVLESGG